MAALEPCDRNIGIFADTGPGQDEISNQPECRRVTGVRGLQPPFIGLRVVPAAEVRLTIQARQVDHRRRIALVGSAAKMLAGRIEVLRTAKRSAHQLAGSILGFSVAQCSELAEDLSGAAHVAWRTRAVSDQPRKGISSVRVPLICSFLGDAVRLRKVALLERRIKLRSPSSRLSAHIGGQQKGRDTA